MHPLLTTGTLATMAQAPVGSTITRALSVSGLLSLVCFTRQMGVILRTCKSHHVASASTSRSKNQAACHYLQATAGSQPPRFLSRLTSHCLSLHSAPVTLALLFSLKEMDRFPSGNRWLPRHPRLLLHHIPVFTLKLQSEEISLSLVTLLTIAIFLTLKFPLLFRWLLLFCLCYLMLLDTYFILLVCLLLIFSPLVF